MIGFYKLGFGHDWMMKDDVVYGKYISSMGSELQGRPSDASVQSTERGNRKGNGTTSFNQVKQKQDADRETRVVEAGITKSELLDESLTTKTNGFHV